MQMKFAGISTALLLTILCSCKSSDDLTRSGKLVFKDDFNRSEIGDNWKDTGGGYRIVNGELWAKGAKNKPLWLTKKLPRNARVEFVARSESDAVDIKAELYGDGKSFAKTTSYTATSYVIVLGGWNNSRSIIARMNEHGDDRKSRTWPLPEKGKKYQFAVTRIGKTLRWYLDSKLFLEMDDSAPLEGPEHEYFAINNWTAEVFFDDIEVYKL